MHAPPGPVVVDRVAARRHARSLRGLLEPTGLRLIIHAPDTLSAGTPEGDRAVAGVLEHAAEAGAEIIVYHGLNFPLLDGPQGRTARERAALEEASLQVLLQRAHALGMRVAIENLAPVYAGPARLCHDPLAVRDLVRRLESPAAGMLLDIGHLNITSDEHRSDSAAIATACAADVVLFHLHDNFGARRRMIDAAGVDPLRLDLHLAPGAGTVPWAQLAPTLEGHDAPLLLEVQPQHRPPLADLQRQAAGLISAATAASTPVAV